MSDTETTVQATEHDVTDMLIPDRYAERRGEPDQWVSKSAAVLTVTLDRSDIPYRFGFGFTGPEGKSRRVYQGPTVPGPYAYAFGLAGVIAANPEHGTWGEMRRARAAGLVIDAKVGDILIFRGHRFVIERDHNRNVKLTLITA